MRRGTERWSVPLAALALALAACNALNGAADLDVCEACSSEGAFPGDATVEGATIPREDAAGAARDAAEAASPIDAAEADAETGALLGCQGVAACERVAFVTSTTYPGDLGGVAGADAKCQARADASTNPRIKGRTFLAWVSTATTSPEQRLTHGTMRYTNATGQLVALDWNDLTDGDLVTGIGVDEAGQAQNGGAWTGTKSNGGNYSGRSCTDWMSVAFPLGGERGNVGGSGNGWSGFQTEPCTSVHHLYCFEK